MDDAVYWDPFAIDDSVLFRVVIVNDSDIAFSPTTPYANLQRRLMCLPLKESPAGIPGVAAPAPAMAPVSFILDLLPGHIRIQEMCQILTTTFVFLLIIRQMTNQKSSP
jgi:hypothetical protein